MIPKIIHYCWFSNSDYPEIVERCISSWERFLPEWEFRLWDRASLDRIDADWLQEALNCKEYAFAADYVRLYAVYHYGGFYLDTDVEVLKDFCSLTVFPYVFGLEDNHGLIQAATFGAEPGNLFIRKCLEYYDSRHFIKPDGLPDKAAVMPKIMQDILGTLPGTVKHLIDAESFDPSEACMQILPVEYFSPKDHWSGKLTNMSQNTYSIHHGMASWVPWGKKVSLWVRRHIPDCISEPLFCLWSIIRPRPKY